MELKDVTITVPGPARLPIANRLLDAVGAVDNLLPGPRAAVARIGADLLDPEYTGPEGEQPRRLRDLIGDLTLKDGGAGRVRYGSVDLGCYDREFLAGVEAAFRSAGLLDAPVLPVGRTVDRAKPVEAADRAWREASSVIGGTGFPSDIEAVVDAVLAELGIEVPA